MEGYNKGMRRKFKWKQRLYYGDNKQNKGSIIEMKTKWRLHAGNAEQN
jgi:hypothetical protein